MRSWRFGLLLSVITVWFWPAMVQADGRPCGIDAPCAIAGGQYYLGFPKNWDERRPMPVLLWFHGHRSSGDSVLKSPTVRRVFRDQGYLVVAPDGALRGNSNIRGWPGRLENDIRNDLAFVRAVMADVAANWPLMPDKILVSGFSSGGSMAWMLACFDGQSFTAFAPVAGTLRMPNPVGDGCPGGPVNVKHFHGFADKQVPIEGRRIRDWHQGDLFAAFGLARAANGCRSQPSDFALDERFSCRSWQGCELGGALELCLHDGGHGLPKGWAEHAYAWFEGLHQTARQSDEEN